MFLMESKFSDDFALSEIFQIDCCRLYLRVETLADITKTCGTLIDENITLGIRRSDYFHPHGFPKQKKPGNLTWGVWRRFLHKFTKNNHQCT